MEICTRENINKTLNLSEQDQHGSIYFDSELGGISLNPSNTKVAFIAEAKKAKNVPFFPVKNSSANKNGNSKQVYGQEYSFTEEWGEQLVGKSQSVIVTVDLQTFQVDVLEDLVPEKYCPGQIQWISDSILVGIAVESIPYRLGLIYCTNRPSGMC